jgi:hypothetical protein
MSLIESQINALIEITLNTNRNISNADEASNNSYNMWHSIGMQLHANFVATHVTLIAASTVCGCTYAPTIPPPPPPDGTDMKNAIQNALRDVTIDPIRNPPSKYLGAQKLIEYIYENYIEIITTFTGANASGAPVTIDITLYHVRVKPLLLANVINFINGISNDYFNTGNDLFSKVVDFNKDLAKLLYDDSVHFIMPSDGVCTISGNPTPLPYSGPVYS